MFREINIESSSNEEIRDLILSLKEDWQPVVLRGNGKKPDRNYWWYFLTNTCELHNDQRQYNFDLSMELTPWWEISYDPERATSYAWAKTSQPLHNDNAWFGDPAEINFFIMEKQSPVGGEQKVYPLHRLLTDLEKEDAQLLNDLKSTEVVIKKGDGKYYNKTTILDLKSEPKIFWNYYRTEKNEPFVDQLCNRFFNYLVSKESTNSVEILRSNTGDCFSFNDTKVLHGRTAFEAKAAGDRVLLQSMWSFSPKPGL